MTKPAFLSAAVAGALVLWPAAVQAQAPADDTLVIWQAARAGQPIPANALPGGMEQGRPTALCAASHQGAREIGRVVGGNCAFGHGGAEVSLPAYDLLLGNSAALAQNPQFVRWVPAQNGQKPPGAFMAAREGETLLPICRAASQGGVTPGKLAGNGCKYAFNGREFAVPQYEVLVVSRAGAAIPTATLSALAANPQAANAPAGSAPTARGSSIGGIGGVTPIDIQGLDLESAMMAIQSQRAELLESQLKSQIDAIQQRNQDVAKFNEQVKQLNAERAKLPTNLAGADLERAQKLDLQIAQLKGQIDSLNSSQQMDMLRMQSLTNKRNEAFDLMTNFIKKVQDNRSSILGNMR
ncbi:MAG: DM9 repeat-containing protein [Alphaproteobacteria bacterium]